MQVLTDDGKIQTIESYARVDPISDYMLMSAPVKLGARWCYATPACMLVEPLSARSGQSSQHVHPCSPLPLPCLPSHRHLPGHFVLGHHVSRAVVPAWSAHWWVACRRPSPGQLPPAKPAGPRTVAGTWLLQPCGLPKSAAPRLSFWLLQTNAPAAAAAAFLQATWYGWWDRTLPGTGRWPPTWRPSCTAARSTLPSGYGCCSCSRPTCCI